MSAVQCVLLGIILTLASCLGEEDCDCAVAGFVVLADEGQVESVTATGDSCEDALLECNGADRTYRSGCGVYYVHPNRAGPCTIEVVLMEGEPISRSVEFSYTDGCCSGYYVAEGPPDVDVSDPEVR